MLKNIRVGVKLRFGWGILTWLLVAVVKVSIKCLSMLRDELAIIVDDQSSKTVHANVARDNNKVIARSLRSALILRESGSSELYRISSTRDEINAS